MSCDGKEFPRAIDVLFSGELAAQPRRELRAHLDGGCASCRAYYHRVSELQQRIAPDEPLSLVDVEALIAQATEPPPRRSRWWAALAGVATTGLVGVFALVLIARWPRAGEGRWQARGGGSMAPALESVRAFCLTTGARGAAIVDAAPFERPPARSSIGCPVDGVLQFAYSLEGATERHLVLIGIDGNRRPLLYAPVLDSGTSLPLQPGVRDRPLPDGIKLSVRHQPGTVAVLALFSAAPISVERVTRAVTEGGAPAAARLVDEVEELSLEVTP